jgi:hypothetical protein
MYRFLGGSQKGFQRRSEVEASYLRFMLARERNQNQLKNYYIIPPLLIVIALLLHVII